ncbi:hypothetical protein ACLB2K_002066 [Fragaria x ananassa]
MHGVRRQVGWSNCFSVSCKVVADRKGKRTSRVGGLALLWTTDTKISLLSYSDFHIDVMVGETTDQWRFTGIYVQPKAELRHLSWSLIRRLHGNCDVAWVLGGDFNEIVSLKEKEGGNMIRRRFIENFVDVLEECSLTNLHSYGPTFTWKGVRHGFEVKERLDRFVTNPSWRHRFPKSRVIHLNPNESDHLLILLEIRKSGRKKKKKKRRWRFEEYWLRESECQTVVEAGWESITDTDPFLRVSKKIMNTRESLILWSKEKFGSLKKDIKAVRSKLAWFYDHSPSSPPNPARAHLEAQLQELLQKEHVFWKQRSRVLWLSEGDMNTHFFHQSATNRKKKNLIRGLRDVDGIWRSEDDEIERIVLDYYTNLFRSSSPSNMLEVIHNVPSFVTTEMNEGLVAEISEEEVWNALSQMKPMKAPGPDGFAPCFYQRFWSIIGRDVVQVVRAFLESEERLREINYTHVTLIPKVKTPDTMNQLRPISLCNVLYKIGSKVLANRMKPMLESIIPESQSAFVPGRHISDNSIIAFKVSHYLKRLYGSGDGYAALKLDMSKAYDRVEWSFLEGIMRQMGFDRRWIEMVLRCVQTVSYSFVVNGEVRGMVQPQRGLRQGDSISPYLFLLYAEAFSRLIMEAEARGHLHGVKICPRAPTISHLLFADDSFVFFRATEEECETVREVLLKYEMVTSQQEKIDKRARGWREKTLSIAGKEILIKAVLQSIPNYVMSCFELPKHLCNAIHSSLARFWWGDNDNGKKIHWLSWHKLCVPKSEGGMGFRNMTYFNRALLAKQGWRLLRRPDALVARLLKAKYFSDTDFLHATCGSDPSFVWRSLLVGRDTVLKKGMRFTVGNGSSIKIWADPWLPLPHNFRPFSTPKEGTETWRVCDLMDEEAMEWVEHVVIELFTEEEAAMILHNTGRARRKYWSKVWKAQVPPKVRGFIWRLCRDIVPTRAALHRKFYVSDMTCVFCNKGVETGLHLFRDCSMACIFWKHNPLHLKSQSFPGVTIAEWIGVVMDRLSGQQLDVFFVSLWALWTERNNILWKGRSCDPFNMSIWALQFLEDYKKVHNKLKVKMKRAKARWSCPPSGRLKLNVDGAFLEDRRVGGIGVVARDEHGVCLVALSRHMPYAQSAMHMEAEALQASLLIAIYRGWNEIEVESDCETLLQALAKYGDVVEVNAILVDCRHYLMAFDYVLLRHVNREANGVANRLAHLARSSVFDELWED